MSNNISNSSSNINNSKNNPREFYNILDIPKPKLLSYSIFTIVGVACKIWISMNRVTITNGDKLVKEIEKTYELKRPMITIANHQSNLDDPLIWGALLPNSIFMNPAKQRWTLGASNILFTNWFYSKFFSLGKCIKIVRGDGIYQEGMNESIDRLSEGQWLHLFPEGKVSQQTQLLYFKWGVGRLVGECYNRTGIVPLIVPIYHQGMDKAMPLGKTPIPRVGIDIDIKIGDNIYCGDLISKYLSDHGVNNLKEYLSPEKYSPQQIEERQKEFYKAITLHIEEKYQENIPTKNRGRFSHPSIRNNIKQE